MTRYLLIYAATVTLLLAGLSRRHLNEERRLNANIRALNSSVAFYRDRHDRQCADTEVLRLRCAEFERLRAEDARQLREAGIRLRRLEALSTTRTASRTEVRTPLRDTVVVTRRDTVFLRDTLRLFRWHDAWVTIEGAIDKDSVRCRIESVDTLRQTVHRIPRRFLFIRWGTKALRQQIVSTNPHTRIVGAEYIRIE